MGLLRQHIFRPFIGPTGFGLALGILLVLWPVFQPQLKRNTTLDIVRLKTAICQYKGLNASFEEVTKAYALKVYNKPYLVDWQAQTNPTNPASETLITAFFRTLGPLEDVSTPNQEALNTRDNAAPLFGVSWRLNDLGAMRISPHNAYAQDALAVYRYTVEEFLAQMVVVTRSTELRAERGSNQPSIAHISPGTVLLQEREEEAWVYVRIPSSPTRGWLEKSMLQTLEP
jgi:hypothetical protein